jgi:hypothetical protein
MIEEYRRRRGERISLLHAVEQVGTAADFPFHPPRLEIVVRPANLD